MVEDVPRWVEHGECYDDVTVYTAQLEGSVKYEVWYWYDCVVIDFTVKYLFSSITVVLYTCRTHSAHLDVPNMVLN